MEIFHITMSLHRFQFIVACLWFDDKNTREIRCETNKLAPIRNIFKHLAKNFQKMFSPGEYMTIDEKIEIFRGRCLFR